MKNRNKLMIVAVSLMSFSACTKLEEKLNSETTAGGGGGGSVNVASLLTGAYRSFEGIFMDQARMWAAQEHSSDEAVGPTRGGDWDDNGIWRVYHNHKWTSEHDFLTATFRQLAQSQFAATTVLDNNPTPQQAAEAKFLRAFAMWNVLDGWDQVPYRSTSLGDLTQTLPEVKKGTEAADFIIAELNAAIPNLPAGAGIGVASKDAAKALLMKLYLNKGVYANRETPTFAAADMNQVISLADQILAGSYSLGTNFFDNFAPTNNAIGTELIYTLRADNGAGVGGNGPMFQAFCGLHYNMNPSGWNGFCTLGDFYDKFEAADKRRGGAYTGLTNVTGLRTGFLFGQQFNQSGVALNDRKGNPLSFTKEVKLKETGNNLEVTGVRVIKYVPDLVHQFPWDNDLVIFRLADVLLMKAEAILRGGTATNVAPYGNTAASIVNYIRTHSTRGVAALGTVNLTTVYDERGRELYWEGWRRNDMVRFGTFLAARALKPDVSPSYRLIYPIPNEQLTINPNLTQNAGYN
jgi:starch-binding outer membrane protein, SusD/RagB family